LREHIKRAGRKMRKQIKRSLAVLLVSGLLVALAAGAALAVIVDCGGGPCYGGNGPDRLNESPRHDRMYGYGGRDFLRANLYSGDRDVLYGGGGNDLNSSWDRDLNDYVDCGSGYDTAWVDTGEGTINCERVYER
jgi:hypothetical protein